MQKFTIEWVETNTDGEEYTLDADIIANNKHEALDKAELLNAEGQFFEVIATTAA